MIASIITHPLVVASLISFLLGSFGYVLIRLWLMPVLRYTKMKRAVLSILNGYSQQMNATPDKMEVDKTHLRRLSGDLSSVYNNALPYWYRLLLSKRGEEPLKVSSLLMKLANTKDRDHAARQMQDIRTRLGQRDGREKR